MPNVTQKGQVTIPKEIRTLLKINEGDEVVFEIDKNNVVVRKRKKKPDFRKYIGFIKNKYHNADEIVNKLRDGD